MHITQSLVRKPIDFIERVANYLYTHQILFCITLTGFLLSLYEHTLTYIASPKFALYYSDTLISIAFFISIFTGGCIYLIRKKINVKHTEEVLKQDNTSKTFNWLFLLLLIYSFFCLILPHNFNPEAPYDLKNKLLLRHINNSMIYEQETFQLFQLKALTAVFTCYLIGAISLIT